ncbi:hypothetical protein D3C74_384550 [compost metagenome]
MSVSTVRIDVELARKIQFLAEERLKNKPNRFSLATLIGDIGCDSPQNRFRLDQQIPFPRYPKLIFDQEGSLIQQIQAACQQLFGRIDRLAVTLKIKATVQFG